MDTVAALFPQENELGAKQLGVIAKAITLG